MNNYLIRKLRTRELFCKRSFYRKWSGMNFLKSKNLFFFPDNFSWSRDRAFILSVIYQFIQDFREFFGINHQDVKHVP